tara:strand:- start:1282 stop:2016 length:735 start_codon:yes stop_codon:yes gene_type:complete
MPENGEQPVCKILSIDWDYFFPSATDYDMGHSETPMMAELIWSVRVAHKNPRTGETLLDEYRPDEKRLHNAVAAIGRRCIAADVTVRVQDSHHGLIDFCRELEAGAGDTIASYDAHHDHGYGTTLKGSDCSNWAQHVAPAVTVNYPQWRRDDPEGDPDTTPVHVRYTDRIMENDLDFDALFICRSGGWTPPWWDGQFGLLTFVAGVQDLPRRSPSLGEAEQMRDAMQQQLETITTHTLNPTKEQ